MILITGAQGQIGCDLAIALRQQYGPQAVLESGRRSRSPDRSPYVTLDVTQPEQLRHVVETYAIRTIYHLAGLLSAKGEARPRQCWNVNIQGLKNVLELAQARRLRVFWPSSIAVFGAGAPRHRVSQQTVLEPDTIYGVTKVTGELLCRYYAQRFGVDVRSLRLPGLISYRTLPGGGTTDFAVEMFHGALQSGHYTCFVKPDTRLPMMYMPDAIRAMQALMAAEADAITVRSSYNLAAVSFSAAELVAAIQTHLPQFTCDYRPDFRQAIADSWPITLDDSAARRDWGWRPAYDLPRIVEDMLVHLRQRYSHAHHSIAS
ncbi:MAG: NAD-dependent epimerase/dehydratase family protein [Leptolyngbya sp. SIO4C5]|nr:NAD-dependent epimerase/dehydratase family protein [Leptolyngbya sp. SIO4C5]